MEYPFRGKAVDAREGEIVPSHLQGFGRERGRQKPVNPTLNEIDSAILEVALSLEEGEIRDGFVSRTYRFDPDGLLEMRQLIADAKSAAVYFLNARERRSEIAFDLASEWTHTHEPLSIAEQEVEMPGAKLGNYRLVRRIGEGGGGVVYEAEQEEPIQRRVAVKIVRLGMNTESVIARFDIERQALALMDHPNIARVFETGATSTGRPFFIMEYVEGEKITTFCDDAGWDIERRLKLFMQVCDAIQHAHQKGVVHRDIKPSNILVSSGNGNNAPKIIDFGIAKALNPEAFSRPVETSHDQVFGTPVYMSPEQIDLTGLDVDTRSDIYSLGVLLYEILTSCTPFEGKDFSSCGVSMMRNIILTSKIRTPSQVVLGFDAERAGVVAACRKTTSSQLVRQMKGDLDRIVMKAIDRDRTRRYSTVNSMILDVQRFLSNQPVTATPPSRLYLFGKFVRRNRFSFVAGNLVLLSLVAGLVISAMLYNRERTALAEQIRLRAEAQAARAEEQRLRLQADARENVARVAILLDQGRIEEAESLRKKFPLDAVEPSLEAAAVFRFLGDWHANHGRWEEGAQCYKLLMQANRLDDPAKVLDRSDLIAISAMLMDYREEDYLVFRQEVAEHYWEPKSKHQAEHLLKVCLIAPADQALLDRLAFGVKVLGDPKVAPLPSWAALSRGLYEYRSGNLDAALNVCRDGLTDHDVKDACRSSLRSVMSMIFVKKGLDEEARKELEISRDIIAETRGREYLNGGSIPQIWFDWIIADVLHREAELTRARNRE
jgi:eukaryotic-like serine/threonine-protein kinase